MIYLLHLRDHMFPVALLLGVGYALARRGWVPLRVASALCLYLFSPAVAVVVSLYALHFDCQPRFVSRTVVVSTFASLATVALVLFLV